MATFEGKSGIGDITQLKLGGAFRKIPGYEGGLMGDDLPIQIHHSGAIALANAVALQAPIYAPFDMKLVSVSLLFTVKPSANTIIQYGTSADADGFVSYSALASVVVTGTRADGVTLATTLGANASAGNLIGWGTSTAGPTSGTAYGVAVWAPRM